ncbi:GTP cyclohydrolase II, partial [Ramicandelaber brevisporus]
EMRCEVQARIPNPEGTFRLHLYRGSADGKEHMAIVYGDDIISESLNQLRSGDNELVRRTRGAATSVSDEQSAKELVQQRTAQTAERGPPLVRIHSECFTGETVMSTRCDCGYQLAEAMRLMREEGRGIVVYLRQEGRGIGLMEKLRAYNLQDMGHDTVTANVLLNHPPDARTYESAHAILRDLGARNIRLLTNNPDKIEKITADGTINVTEPVPMIPRWWFENEAGATEPAGTADRYLLTKITRMRHMLP